MSRAKADGEPAPMSIRRSDLLARGLTDREIRAAVASGRIIKLRTGVFCAPGTADPCIRAGSARGRLACVSELRRRGIFVLEHSTLHMHIPRTASRLPPASSHEQIHRGSLRRQPHPRSLSVEVFDALLGAVQCQPPRAALATLDSALHHGLLVEDDLDELFGELPRRYRRLRRLLDKRAEAGPETLMRLILRSIGCSFEVQVSIDGVGRVDFVVDGWLIVECDSREFHSEWTHQLRDRRRDQAAAARGYATYRPVAEDIMWHADDVRAAVTGLLVGRGRARVRA